MRRAILRRYTVTRYITSKLLSFPTMLNVSNRQIHSFPFSFSFSIFPASFISLLVFSRLVFSLHFSRFTHTVRSRPLSGIPHRRNNYYYESDPGQETTIAFSFLFLFPTPAPSFIIPSCSWTPHRIHRACFILASYRVIFHRTEHSGHSGGLSGGPRR